MAQDFDEFPIYDDLIKPGTNKMSAYWASFMASFKQNLTGYLSQNGSFMPIVSTVQRDQIQTPQNGQMIYNSTLNTGQYFKNGVWVNF